VCGEPNEKGHLAVNTSEGYAGHSPSADVLLIDDVGINARAADIRQSPTTPAAIGYHLVFRVPHALVPLMWQNKRVLFRLLFEASAETLLEVAADPEHLGAEIGCLSILHTWGQTLQRHHTFTVSCPVVGGLWTANGGYRRRRDSFCRSES